LSANKALNQNLENGLVHQLWKSIHAFGMVEAQAGSLTASQNYDCRETISDYPLALHIDQHGLLSGHFIDTFGAFITKGLNNVV